MPRIAHMALTIAFCVSIALVGEYWISLVKTRIPVASVQLLAKEIYTQRDLDVYTKSDKNGDLVLIVRRKFRLADALVPSALTGLILGAWYTRPKQKQEAEQVAA